MFRIKNKFNTLKVIFLFLFIIKYSFAYAYEYVIIKGIDVNMRSAPTLSSEIIDQLENGEFTFFLEKSTSKFKIDVEEHNWYKLRNQKKQIGWVYGKYCYYLDESKEPEKYYKQIIDKRIVVESYFEGHGEKLTGVNFKQLDKYNLILFEYKSTGDYSVLNPLEFYEYKNKLEYVLKCFPEDKIYLYNDYIFRLSPKYCIQVYNRNIKEKIFDNFEYKKVANIRIRDYKTEPYGTYLEFDEVNRILIKHIQEKKEDTVTIERYQFKDGKFVKID
jgi:hypothetical protein